VKSAAVVTGFPDVNFQGSGRPGSETVEKVAGGASHEVACRGRVDAKTGRRRAESVKARAKAGLRGAIVVSRVLGIGSDERRLNS